MATLTQSNVTFTLNADVVSPFGGKYTNDMNFDADTGRYNVDQTKLNSLGVGKSVNAVEIDWNGAKLGIGEDNSTGITTTGELLKLIKEYTDTKIAKLQNRVDALEAALSTLAQNVGSLVTIANG